jgi:hypothetical protein
MGRSVTDFGLGRFATANERMGSPYDLKWRASR